MTDADIIKLLLGIVIALVTSLYANFIYEMRKLRRNVHNIRNTVTHHEFRLIRLENEAKLPEFKYPQESDGD